MANGDKDQNANVGNKGDHTGNVDTVSREEDQPREDIEPPKYQIVTHGFKSHKAKKRG